MSLRQTLAALGLVLWLTPAVGWAAIVTVTGVVNDGTDPVEGATVCGIDWNAHGRVAMPTTSCVVTDATGAFEVDTTLASDGQSNFGQIVAGAEGYLSADIYADEGATNDVTLTLDPLSAPDNPDYVWWKPPGDMVDLGCGTCHTTIVSQWSEGMHSLAAADPLVFDMYNGTDANGTPNVAPGYRLEHDDEGECSGCHAATAVWTEGRSIDLNEVDGVHTWGVYCETCHKIRSVDIGSDPGALGAITLWRPDYNDGAGNYFQFAFGPYPNVTGHSMLTSYSPLMRQAELCAGCHQYVNRNGVPVMDSFTDWQAVGTPESTLPCQACHMKDVFGLKPDEEPMTWLVDDAMIRSMSAQQRDPNDVYRHEMWGGAQYAAHALDLTMTARQQGGELVVRTSTVNVGANHRVPTGMPFREMVLVISAVSTGSQTALELVEGPQIVAPRGGDLAGLPGKIFAKSLGDAEGNLTFAFWDATQTLEDTRLATGETDESTFRFALTESGPVAVTARLLYRRFAQPLADAKSWDMGEQEVGHAERTVDVDAPDAGPGGDGGGADGGTGDDFEEGCTCRALPGMSDRAPARSSVVLLIGAVTILARSRRRR